MHLCCCFSVQMYSTAINLLIMVIACPVQGGGDSAGHWLRLVAFDGHLAGVRRKVLPDGFWDGHPASSSHKSGISCDNNMGFIIWV